MFNLITKLEDRKAYRTIDIEIRFIKLANPVISTFLSNLFNVCLSNRYQYTNILGHYSSNNKIIIGVQQGSRLGPLLFLLYINDLPLSSNFDSILMILQ